MEERGVFLMGEAEKVFVLLGGKGGMRMNGSRFENIVPFHTTEESRSGYRFLSSGY